MTTANFMLRVTAAMALSLVAGIVTVVACRYWVGGEFIPSVAGVLATLVTYGLACMALGLDDSEPPRA